MAFLSGLKVAYDSLGSEISRTFSSSNEDPLVQSREVEPGASRGDTEEGIKATDPEGFNESSVYSTPKVEPKPTSVKKDGEGCKDTNDWGERGERKPPSKTKACSKSPRSETHSLILGDSQSTGGSSPTPTGGSDADSGERGEGSGGGDMTKASASEGRKPLTLTPTKAGASGRSQLESLSREDWVKYSRRQGLLLQKTKARCEELTKELEAVRKVSTASSSGDGGGSGEVSVLREEMQVVRSECDMAVSKNRTLRQKVTELEHSKADLSDRLQALEMAHSKLTTLFREEQDEKRNEEQQREEERDRASLQQQKAAEDTYRELEEKVDAIKLLNLKLSDEASTLRTQLVEEVKSSSLKIKKLEDDNLAAELKFGDLLKKAKKLQSEVKVGREKQLALGSLEENMRSMEEAMATKVLAVTEQLESVMHDCKSREDVLKKEVEDAMGRCILSDRNLAESVGKNDSLEDELNCMKSTCADLEQGLATSQSDMELLREEEKELRLQHSKLEQKLVASQASVDAAKEETSTQISQMEVSLADAARREVTLREEVAVLESKYTQLKQNLASKGECDDGLEVELCELKSRLSLVEKALEEEKHQKEYLFESSEQLRESALQSHHRASELADECHKLTNELQKMQEMEHKVSSELVDTKEKLNRCHVELDTEMARSRTHLEGMESQVLELNSNLERTLHRLEERQREVDELKDAQRLDEENRKSELDQALSYSSEMEEKLHFKEECWSKRTSELEQNLEERVEKLQAADKDLTTLRSTLQLLSKEKESALEHIENLNSDIAELLDQDRLRSVEQSDSLRSDQVDREDGAEITSQLVLLQEQNNQLCRECKELKEKNLEMVEGLRSERDEARAEVEKSRGVLEERVQRARDLQGKETSSLREENKKLMAFAVKLKKELSDTRERESSLSQQLQSLQKINRDEVDELERKLGSVTEEKRVIDEVLKGEIIALQAKHEEDASRVSILSADSERYRAELAELGIVSGCEVASLQAELAASRSENNTNRMVTEAAESEVRGVRVDLEREMRAHEETRQRLLLMEKESKSSSLMSMELEDYQRAIEALEGGMATKDQLLEKANKDGQIQQESLQHMSKDMELLTQQHSQSEETIYKLKQLLVKHKKELVEAKRREEELHNTMAELQKQLEMERQGSELAKVEVSQYTANIETMKQQSEVSVGNLEIINRGLEHRLTLAQSELATTKTALATYQSDYDNYKIRVHSVLKQKSDGPGQTQINTELKHKYEAELVRLNAEIQELKSQLRSHLVEHEEMLAEHEQFAAHHKQLLQEAERTRVGLELALRHETAQHSLQSQEQSKLVVKLQHEMEDVTTSFKTQLHQLQEEHNKVVMGVKTELEVVQSDFTRLQKEMDNRVLVGAQSTASIASTAGPSTSSVKDGMVVSIGERPRNIIGNNRPPYEQRSSGEGMEQSQLESMSRSSMPPTPDSSINFDRLLSLGEDELASPTTTVNHEKKFETSSDRIIKYQGQLKVAAKKLKHLTELLRESEASALRLGDQAKVLKEEIRRLERNREREKGVSNMEYLKNVILKFLHNEGEEKKALVPIIEKLLLLNSHEAKFLTDSIQGKTPELPDVNTDKVMPKTSNWSSYVYRWTGY